MMPSVYDSDNMRRHKEAQRQMAAANASSRAAHETAKGNELFKEILKELKEIKELLRETNEKEMD